MFNFEKISLNLSFPPFYFFLFLILLIGYTIYVYRYTIPNINPSKKILLVSLRSLALLLILFVFFEPIVTLAKKKILEPVNLIFLDNSRSIQIKDGTDREKTVINFVKGLEQNNLSNNSELLTFGNKIQKLSYDSLKDLNFSEGSTNFAKIFTGIANTDRNISSITIVSDGVITEGSNPLHTAEKLNIPIFTVGVGDSTSRNDVEVKNVLYNQMIYAQTSTAIVASIANNGFANKNITVTLYENDAVVEQKNVTLNEVGIQNVNFTYTPKSGGEKKLAVVASNSTGEFTFANNKKVFYVNVLSNKVKVLVVAGSPSSDLSFIKNTLKSDKNFEVNSITQFAEDKFIEKNNKQELIDSANVFFLVGFPSKETSPQLLQSILNKISNKDIPFFITLSSGVDFNKLKQIQNELPFAIGNISNDYIEVQPDIHPDQMDNTLLRNNSVNPIDAWNNLPPIYQPNVNITPKPEDQVVSKVKINNIPMNRPLILTSVLGNKKSIAVLAKNIWRWKLETAPKNLDLFDRFIISSVKWLNSNEAHKRVTIKTSKKLYSLGEQIEFNGQVYDQAFNPVSDADVKIKINYGKENYDVNLNSVGNGLYEGTFQTNQAGNYSFTGEALLNNNKLGTDKGKFNVGEVDIEMLNPRMNYEFLNILSNQTNGKFFYNSNYIQLYPILKALNKKTSKYKIEVSDINLWSNEWLLIIAILLFGLEWFFRKRFGML